MKRPSERIVEIQSKTFAGGGGVNEVLASTVAFLDEYHAELKAKIIESAERATSKGVLQAKIDDTVHYFIDADIFIKSLNELL